MGMVRHVAGQETAVLIKDPLSLNRASLIRIGGRAGLSLALLAVFVWLLADRWAQIDGAALRQALAGLGYAQWAAAVAFTALSFWAVGRYDAVLHRHFATGTPARMARRAGVCAIAVSQTIGLGLISGTILRWRMLPGTSLWAATRLTAAVALSFLAGWAVVTSAVLIALADAPFRGWAALVLTAATGLAAVSIWAPRLPGLRFRWPNAFTLLRLLGLCSADTMAAAMAFHMLQPVALDLPFATLLPAFLLALGAGLALGTPGGMGAFEMSLIALLPLGEHSDLLAAILAWRLVYYAVPALLGAALAILGPRAQSLPPKLAQALPKELPAEFGLRHQGEVSVATMAGQAWMLGRRSHTMIALFDPINARQGPVLDRALTGLRHLARSENCLPVVYKASKRLTARARLQGQSVRRIGWEAWLSPTCYHLAASSRSGLRRKLRRAEAAGVHVRYCDAAHAPWAELDRLATDWFSTHGGERGFSMGRHDRAYLAHQRLYVAWLKDKPVAYASFHTAPQEWALDLMRHQTSVPDGTMHSLVQAAMNDAKLALIPRLSLTAVPEGAIGNRRGRGDLVSRLIAALAPETACSGLYQFKCCFAPHWVPLYLIAPNRVGLVLAGLSLWRAITRPAPLPAPNMREIERDHAEYEFASGCATWHIAQDSR